MAGAPVLPDTRVSTIRVARRPRYTSVDRRTLNDEALSFRARGVLVWLLDKPDDWRADAESIARAGKEGRDAVRAALKELEAAGYLVRRRYREGGTWRCEHTLYEHPSLADLDDDQGGKPAQVDQQQLTSAGQPGDVLNPPGTDTDTGTDTTRASPEQAVIAAGFDRFWQAFPAKRAKGAAVRVWARAVRVAGGVEVIVAGAERYRDDPNRDAGYTMNPATWLNGQCWNDAPLARKGPRPGQPNRTKVVVDDDREAPAGRLDL